MNKSLKLGLSLLLLLVAVFLSYKLYENIMQPIRFEKAYKGRAEVVKQKMLKIRDAELAYFDVYQHYTGDFDTLINFIKNDSLTVIKSKGIVPDSIYLKAKSKKEAVDRAIKLGIITRDTIKVSVRDSLFKNYDPDTLRYVPFSDPLEDFQLQSGYIKTMSKATRPVFELKVHNNTFTKGLDRQMVINLNDKARDNDEFPGFIVGSMTEVTTSGNW